MCSTGAAGSSVSLPKGTSAAKGGEILIFTIHFFRPFTGSRVSDHVAFFLPVCPVHLLQMMKIFTFSDTLQASVGQSATLGRPSNLFSGYQFNLSDNR